MVEISDNCIWELFDHIKSTKAKANSKYIDYIKEKDPSARLRKCNEYISAAEDLSQMQIVLATLGLSESFRKFEETDEIR